MSTETFVEQLYQKFLFRDSDTAGKADWISRLESGQESIAQVTYNFIKSPEFTGRASTVSELYFLLFNRVPDNDGMQHWLNMLDQGNSTKDLINAFIGSQEYFNLYGDVVSNDDFTTRLFQKSLGRDPTDNELTSFDPNDRFIIPRMHASSMDYSRAGVIETLSYYSDFKQKHSTSIENTSIYYGVLGRAPTEQELSSAPDSSVDLINTLYGHSEYTGEALPDTNFIGFSQASTTVMENSGNLAITLTRTGPFDNAATVNYTLKATDSTQASDFSSNTGTATFEKDASTATIQLPLADNSTSQLNRSYTLEITSADGGKVSPTTSTHTLQINDDDELQYTPSNIKAFTDVAQSNGITIHGVEADDVFGLEVCGAGDMNGDGLNDFIITGRDKAYVVFGDNDLANTRLNLATLDGSNGAVIKGESLKKVAAVGDINGDGFDDVVINDRALADGTERAFLLFGQGGTWQSEMTPFDQSSTSNAVNGVSFTNTVQNQYPLSVSGVGDVNGDGIDDLFISSPDPLRSENDQNTTGRMNVIYGQKGAWDPSFDLSSFSNSQGAIVEISQNQTANDPSVYHFGVNHVGDLNKDGIDDLVIPKEQSGDAVSATVLYGKNGGWNAPVFLDTLPETEIDTIATTPQFRTPDSAGDFNGDGIADVMLSVRGNINKRVVDIIFGSEKGFPSGFATDSLDGSNGIAIVDSGTDWEKSVFTASHLGDINKDGYSDIIVNRTSNTENTQVLYILYGHPTAADETIDLNTLTPQQGLRLQNTNNAKGDFSSLSGTGDVNGDGYSDFLVSDSSVSIVGPPPTTGEAYLIFGSSQLFG